MDTPISNELLELQAAIDQPSSVEDELRAMQMLVEAFTPLDRTARQRVMDWARARYAALDDSHLTLQMTKLLTNTIDAVAAHREATPNQQSNADKTLYTRVLDGTRYEPKVRTQVAPR